MKLFATHIAVALVLVLASLASGCGGSSVAQQIQPTASTTSPTAASGPSAASVSPTPATPAASTPVPSTAGTPLPPGLSAGNTGTPSRPSNGSTMADEIRAANEQASKLNTGWTQSIRAWKITTDKNKMKQ